MPDLWNIFSIGRRRGAEDQLTEMLVWLTSAVPDVGGAVVRLGLGEIEFDAAQLEAATQHDIATGRLDAVFSSTSLVLVVESKLRSSYGNGQLLRYLDWLGAPERANRTHRALMTLTARDAPWRADDSAQAKKLGVVEAARRWQDLFDALSEVAAKPGRDELSARLVQEFLEMLAGEGLIPLNPLEGKELLDAWSRSEAVIRRYHDYFRACENVVAEALHAKPRNPLTATQSYIYRDFETPEHELIAVGLNSSDDGLSITPKVYRHAPIAWLSIQADAWPDWDAAIERLEATPPSGWRVDPNRWWGRPRVWRYLDEIVGTGTFDELSTRFAAACGQARAWLSSAPARRTCELPLSLSAASRKRGRLRDAPLREPCVIVCSGGPAPTMTGPATCLTPPGTRPVTELGEHWA